MYDGAVNFSRSPLATEADAWADSAKRCGCENVHRCQLTPTKCMKMGKGLRNALTRLSRFGLDSNQIITSFQRRESSCAVGGGWVSLTNVAKSDAKMLIVALDIRGSSKIPPHNQNYFIGNHLAIFFANLDLIFNGQMTTALLRRRDRRIKEEDVSFAGFLTRFSFKQTSEHWASRRDSNWM